MKFADALRSCSAYLMAYTSCTGVIFCLLLCWSATRPRIFHSLYLQALFLDDLRPLADLVPNEGPGFVTAAAHHIDAIALEHLAPPAAPRSSWLPASPPAADRSRLPAFQPVRPARTSSRPRTRVASRRWSAHRAAPPCASKRARQRAHSAPGRERHDQPDRLDRIVRRDGMRRAMRVERTRTPLRTIRSVS